MQLMFYYLFSLTAKMYILVVKYLLHKRCCCRVSTHQSFTSSCPCQTPVQDADLSNQAPPELGKQKNVAELGSENKEHEVSREALELRAEQGSEEQNQEAPTRPRQVENEVSEVEIPNVGRIMVRADADGYNEEVNKIF